MLSHRLIVAVTLLLTSCEVPRSADEGGMQQRQTVESPAARPSAPPTKAPTVVAATDGIQSETQKVDRRVPPPMEPQSQGSRIESVLGYRLVDPGSLAVADVEAPVEKRAQVPDRVAARRPIAEGALAVIANLPSLEVALLAQGFDVVDRALLQQLEFEHFFQHAQASEAELDRVVTGTAPGSARMSFGAPLVGRDVMKSYGASWWGRFGVGARPLLNGGDPKASGALQTGRFVSARLVLSVEGIHYDVRQEHLQSLAPAAEHVPQVPLITGWIESDPETGTTWQAAEGDSFQFEAVGGVAYFDPERRQLWRFRNAWVGARVSRDEFRGLASSTEVHECERCRHATTEVKSAAGEFPLRWKCPVCEHIHDVVYLAGYCNEEHRDWDDQVTVQAEILPAAPGVYPVAPMQAPAGDLSAGLCLSSAPRDAGEVQSLIGGLLGDREPSAVCWVREDGSALQIAAQDWRALRVLVGAPRWPLPAVDQDGRQRFEPATDVLVETEADLPVERGQLSMRLVDTETGRVLLSGLISSDYLAAMPAQKRVSFGPAGVRPGSWPSRDDQRAVIEQDLVNRIAQLLKP